MDELKEMLASIAKEGIDLDGTVNQFSEYVTRETDKNTTSLAKNRDTILGEKRQKAEELEAVKAKYGFLDNIDGFNQDVYNDTLSQLETYKTAQSQNADEFTQQLNEKYELGKNSALATTQPKLDSLERENKRIAEENTGLQSKWENFLVERKVKDSLASIGVQTNPYWLNGFLSEVKPSFNEEGLADIAVPHKGNLIPMDDFLSVFPTTDMGKSMIPAGYNVGGSSKGNNGNTKNPRTAEDLREMTDPVARRAALAEMYKKAGIR